MRNSLSIVVLTHNDELKIVDCLENLRFAQELVIVDDNSTDRTVEIAKQYASSVLRRPLNGNFSNQRNFALNNVHNSWVLFVDSDELITNFLKEEILSKIQLKEFAGYYVKRIDYMWGRKILHGEAGEVNLLRLARKNSGKWHGKVHEEWQVNGKKAILSNPLIHVPHQTVKDFIRDIDEYSSLRSEELSDAGQKVTPVEILFYPLAKFIQNFYIRKGYKDGIPGFLYAVIMSFHSFLVRAKLYQLEKHE